MPATTRERALEAAVDVLGTDGVRALSHARVDERAGLPPGSTSNWFPIRRALLQRPVALRVRNTSAFRPTDPHAGSSMTSLPAPPR